MSRLASGLTLARDLAAVLADRVSPARPRSAASATFNGLFTREKVAALTPAAESLAAFDTYLRRALRSKRFAGQIVFEYGTLLAAIDDWDGLVVADIGTGRSTLPRWMAAHGASVCAFDLPLAVERPIEGWQGRVDRWLAGSAVHRTSRAAGTLTSLPFRSDSCDVVTSLSVLEHLDTDPRSKRFVEPAEQRRRLRLALDEMIRVCRPDGLLYITSDCCDFTRATRDAWRGAYYHGGSDLSGAWPAVDVPALFYDYLANRGCQLVGANDYSAARVADDDTCWIWRGPHFSAFSVLARKTS